jgi:hypothetical protein
MTLMFLVVLTTTHLEDADLVATTVGNDSSRNGGTSYQRGAYNNLFTVSDHQHFFEYDLAVDVCRYLFYFEFFAEATLYCLPPVFMTAYIRLAPKEDLPRITRRRTRNYTQAQKVVNNFISLAAWPTGHGCLQGFSGNIPRFWLR